MQKILDLHFKGIAHTFSWINIVELLILCIILFAIYAKFIRKSPSKKLFKGIISIFLVYIFSKFLLALNLLIIGRFLEATSLILLFSLVVIFQPELRRFVGYLGQPGFIHKVFFAPSKSEEKFNINFVKELSDAIKYLSKSKIGALLVFQEDDNMSAYSGIGTKILGAISSELILTIFHPNTALHDGAMVMTTDKIIAAGVLLPLTEDPELSWQYGTRHRAAIGITEVSDAISIVVSEETGFVSIVKGGQLKKIETVEMLTEELEKLLYEKNNPQKKKIKKLANFNNLQNPIDNTVTEKNSTN